MMPGDTKPLSPEQTMLYDIFKLKADLEKVSAMAETAYRLLVVSNGVPSIVDRLRNIEKGLLDHIADTIVEREKREKEETDDRKAKKDFRDKIIIAVFTLAASGTVWFVVNTYSHLIKSTP